MNLHSPFGSWLKISCWICWLVEKISFWIQPLLSIHGRSNCLDVVSSMSTAVHMESDSNCNKRLGASAWSSECQSTACGGLQWTRVVPHVSILFPASQSQPPGWKSPGEYADWLRNFIFGYDRFFQTILMWSHPYRQLFTWSQIAGRLGASAWSSECQNI